MIYAPAQETDLAVSRESGEVGEEGSPGGKRTVHPSRSWAKRDITDQITGSRDRGTVAGAKKSRAELKLFWFYTAGAHVTHRIR